MSQIGPHNFWIRKVPYRNCRAGYHLSPISPYNPNHRRYRYDLEVEIEESEDYVRFEIYRESNGFVFGEVSAGLLTKKNIVIISVSI